MPPAVVAAFMPLAKSIEVVANRTSHFNARNSPSIRTGRDIFFGWSRNRYMCLPIETDGVPRSVLCREMYFTFSAGLGPNCRVYRMTEGSCMQSCGPTAATRLNAAPNE